MSTMMYSEGNEYCLRRHALTGAECGQHRNHTGQHVVVVRPPGQPTGTVQYQTIKWIDC